MHNSFGRWLWFFDFDWFENELDCQKGEVRQYQPHRRVYFLPRPWASVCCGPGFMLFMSWVFWFSTFLNSEISLLSVGATSMDPWDVGPWTYACFEAQNAEFQWHDWILKRSIPLQNCHTFCHSCCHASFVTSQLSSQGKKDSSQAQSSHHSHHIKLVHFGHETMWIWRLWMQMNSHLSILEAFSLHKFGCRTDFRCSHKPF